MKTITATLIKDSTQIDESIKHINQVRKSNKNSWYATSVLFKEYNISIKGYNTWVQRVYINGVETGISSGMDIKVRDFISFFDNLFDSIEYGNYKQYLN